MFYNLEADHFIFIMEPKFQSSFIPKGPIASSASPTSPKIKRPTSILGLVSTVIFSLSVLSAVFVFGYKFYLEYSIKAMAAELEAAKASIEEETVKEIVRLNNRILATESLIDSHMVLSPLLFYLEASTLRNVRFTGFAYSLKEGQPVLIMKGEARGYAALAQQAEVFKRNNDFKNPIFSDLSLDDKGNVVFQFTTEINRNFLSYSREVERLPATNNQRPPTNTATTTGATTTPSQATSTPVN